ncbi:AAA family ATPase [Gordonia otitidis]|uniref:AAA+ ATPase domain-containing protein n=1 Tax=Gordonia otitidis (strain DSM 44809 / CCUG 52243 / JCM 12355 / NBRC 100426 / IFM 10032) TaxID=1108044 RepID=H5TIF8_GORO1|nr:AAA family ATPase [Gordonia otitidis]GAB33266.1 hypothetical protein GOOTI_058_00040 [Gordonia otitidis NBRC 100426]
MDEILHELTNTEAVVPLTFNDDYRATRQVADQALESADIVTLTGRVSDDVLKSGLLFPDVDSLIERCVTALLSGHLVLQGPPGTGKTTLSTILARAFDATSQLETATADWSTYDVIGGLHPSATETFGETLVPWLGHVPRAALECASIIARHDDPDENEEHQAHWLIIDEFSRAEIDKAIGPLYTYLGGSTDSPLPLWFGANDHTNKIFIPNRFRIIGTMNTVDTNFVYTFSQGLSRRFRFVYVGVPEKSQVQQELEQLTKNAARWYSATYLHTDDERDEFNERFVTSPKVVKCTKLLEKLLHQLRYADDNDDYLGWPIGSAQLLDLYKQIALHEPYCDGGSEDALLPKLDLAIADSLIPQAADLTRVQIERINDWVTGEPTLPRTARALRHLAQAAATGY